MRFLYASRDFTQPDGHVMQNDNVGADVSGQWPSIGIHSPVLNECLIRVN